VQPACQYTGCSSQAKGAVAGSRPPRAAWRGMQAPTDVAFAARGSRLYEGGRAVKCAMTCLSVVVRAKPVVEGVKNRRVPARSPVGRPHGAERRRRLTAAAVRRLGVVGGLVVASGAQVSIAPSGVGDCAKWEGSFRRRISKASRQAARRKPAPAGANGWLRVSMCQIASVSFRESSIWATLGPRWRPSRRLVCW
jgi:hypothetical protein